MMTIRFSTDLQILAQHAVSSDLFVETLNYFHYSFIYLYHQDLAKCIGGPLLSKILRILSMDFRYRTSGMPDLTVWSPSCGTYKVSRRVWLLLNATPAWLLRHNVSVSVAPLLSVPSQMPLLRKQQMVSLQHLLLVPVVIFNVILASKLNSAKLVSYWQERAWRWSLPVVAKGYNFFEKKNKFRQRRERYWAAASYSTISLFCFCAQLVEVKGPGDRLQSNQKLWMHDLVSLGVSVEVCHVTAHASRKLQAT